MSNENPTHRLRRWQALTVTLLVFGYAGYYLCRSNFSVTLPLIIDDLAARGWDANSAKVSLGALASIGVFAYAIGKFLSGGLADLIGGRRSFLIGTAGAIKFTAPFALGGGFPCFILALGVYRPLQSTRRSRRREITLAMVFVLQLRRGDGRHQLELPVRRRGGAPVYGLADRAWRRLARRLLRGRRRDVDHLHCQLAAAKRITTRDRRDRAAS